MTKQDRERASKPETRPQMQREPKAKMSAELSDDEMGKVSGGVYILYNKQP